MHVVAQVGHDIDCNVQQPTTDALIRRKNVLIWHSWHRKCREIKARFPRQLVAVGILHAPSIRHCVYVSLCISPNFTSLWVAAISDAQEPIHLALAIEFDTWHNADMGDIFYNHVSVQTGGPTGTVGPHKEHTLAAAAVDPAVYPSGLADGKAHVARVVYTPGFDADLIPVTAPPASVNHIKYWVEEGPIRTTAYPHSQGTGSWKREGTGMLRVYLDNLDEPLMVLPIDLSYTLGLRDGRAWAGFTSATGHRFQTHYVLSWQFCEGPSGCAQPMTACEAVGCNPLFPSARYDVPSSTRRDERYADLQSGVPPDTRVRSVIDATRIDFGEDGGSSGAAAGTPATSTGGARYEGDGNEVRWQPSEDEPQESTWGAEPEGWRVQLQQPDVEPVLRDFYAQGETDASPAGR